jgi:quinoprotein glucose dehydrogenase
MLGTLTMRPLLALLFTSALAFSADEVDTPKAPKKNDDRTPKGNAATQTPENAMKSFAVAPGLKVDVWAAEPLLENPVAFSFDAQGRAFVAVTQRRRTSVPDVRKYESWQIENLSLRTVEERIAFLKAKMPESPAKKPKKPEDDINKDGQLDWRDWAVESEEIRIVEDSTGSGRADKSRVLASGFNSLETGLGAGVLAMPDGGAVYTCAPDLWRIAPDGTKTKLATGFGVHVAFGGHDMHGVKMGPDGRIYFTIADCGADAKRVESGELSVERKSNASGAPPASQHSTLNSQLSNPDSGAVFRVWPDGSGLELFAKGLRNPQSLAFNDVGDLFTGDNNADGGDKARWIHVVEGADYGWRIGWQFLPKLGAWNSEGMWHLDVAETNAAILPPVAHITHGPAGISYYPGTGLPEKYRGHFFAADFPGGVRTFALKQKGASYEVDGMAGDDPILQNNSPGEMRGKLLWNLYPSDVQFPPGGGVCVLDWVYGWEKTGKGRIYRVHDPVVDASTAVQETKKLFADGMAKRTPEELAKLLGHADQRVRLKAQSELVERRTFDELTKALGAPDALARLHALWAIGQLARSLENLEPLFSQVSELVFFASGDNEMIEQWVKLLGEMQYAAAAPRFIELLRDESTRLRFSAAQALGKLKAHDAVPALFVALKANADRDPMLRHALVTALAQCANAAELSERQSDSSESVRRGVLLALRRTGCMDAVNFLNDKSPRLRLEAVRAIHDAPIPGVLPALAALDLGSAGVPPAGSRVPREPSKNADASKAKDAPRTSEGRGGDASTGRRDAHPTRDTQNALQSRLAMMDTALTRRVINANYRIGTAETAKRLATVAANSAIAESVRLDALDALAKWPVKLGRDRVLGIVVAGDGQRNAADAAAALAPLTVTLLGENSDGIRIAALNAAGANKLTAAAEAITMLATSSNASGAVRAATLDALAAMDSPRLGALVTASLESGDKTLAETARKLAGKISPAAAVKANAAVLGKGGLREQQQALATIAAETAPEADAVIAQQLDLLLAGKVKAGLVLDLLEAAAERKDAAIQKKLAAFEAARKADDPLARWRECIEGGASKAGKQIFAEKAEAACMRCHKVKGEGGDVGPDLAETGKKLGREYVLRSIVDPNAVIAKGYDNVMVTLKKGDIVAGLLSAETADELTLKNPADAKLRRVKKSEVKERMSLPSAMPPGMGEILTKRELRDLVQYLSALE